MPNFTEDPNEIVKQALNAQGPVKIFKLKRLIIIFVVFILIVTTIPVIFSLWIAQKVTSQALSNVGSPLEMASKIFGSNIDIAGLKKMKEKMDDEKMKTAPVPGDPNHFDPVSTLEKVRNLAGSEASLTKLEMDYVSSDGTLNLNATNYSPKVKYEFIIKTSAPEGVALPPIGAGGSPDGIWFETVSIRAFKPGDSINYRSYSGNSSRHYMITNEGLTIERSAPEYAKPTAALAAPQCSLSDLWKVALEKEAPADAVAQITYRPWGYSFDIIGTHTHLSFDTHCQLKK